MILGVVGLPVLLIFSAFSEVDRGYKIAASIIYCVTMIILYLASTLYHGLTHERAKGIFRVIDHASIYLLIAGTYTPFCLVTLRGQKGWMLFVLLWGMALIGIASELFWKDRPRWVAVIIYLIMGWIALVVMPDIIAVLPPTGFWLIVAGGVAYSIGAIFYVIKKVPYLHSIFHAWVLVGTFLHFFAILLYVII